VSLIPPGPSLLAPGFKLDRYELLCPIAEGGMASVWIARQTGKHGFEKFVAIKTILPKFASDPRFQKMFSDEARIASRIEHTNVAQILDVGEQNDITYLVMEYVDGEALSTLQRAVKRKSLRIPPGALLRIMSDVCGGLHAAHDLHDQDGQPLGVVHRDVSPQNVLVSARGVAKLIDFGIAKARDRVGADTSAGTLKGKVRYMAPEQALGSAIDHRADVWAVGAILYHLLSGTPPYEGENEVQTLQLLTSGRPPAELPTFVHPVVSGVVARALSSEPEKRFATAAELQAAIEDAIAEAKLTTNISTVAGLLAEHVGERTQKRRDAIALGLKAAHDRDRYAQLMRSNVPDGDTVSIVGAASAVARGPTAKTSASEPPSAVTGPTANGKSSGTLGSAAVAVTLRRPSHGKVLALASGAAGATLAIGLLVVLMTRGVPSERARSGTGLPAMAASIPASRGVVNDERTAPTADPTTEMPSATATPTTESAPVAPAVAVTDLPAALSTAPAMNPPHVAARPLSSARAVPTRSTKPRINDGF
jgi:eukaryotic-like serine/threonine-protein kinase